MVLKTAIDQFVAEVEKLFPEYRNNPIDAQISQGGGALVVIDADGYVYGRIFGDNPRRGREVFDIAHKKATQVWLTGYATGDFERKIFAGELDEGKFPISKPDYIGWEGGLPLVVGGHKVSAAFSGYQGTSDQDIIRRAAEKVKT